MTKSIVKFDENWNNLTLFLAFLQVMEPTIPDAYRWSTALNQKIVKMHTAYEDVNGQIPVWYADHKKMQKNGIGSSKEGNVLSLRYETYLHTVYSLCETLSRITARFYPKLSHGFREQKSELLNSKRDVDPTYAKILESVSWYDEVHSMRSEATHFLSGFITISKNGEPGYFNTPKSARKESLKEISKDSIEKHVFKIHKNIDLFLMQYGDHFIQKIDRNKKIAQICLLDGKKYVGAREFTLDDIFNKKPGKCHLPLYQCPIRNSCEAFKATNHAENVK